MVNDYWDRLKNGKMPIRPTLRKCGTVAEGVVEATPVVWQGKLLRFEWVRPNTWGEGHGTATAVTATIILWIWKPRGK